MIAVETLIATAESYESKAAAQDKMVATARETVDTMTAAAALNRQHAAELRKAAAMFSRS